VPDAAPPSDSETDDAVCWPRKGEDVTKGLRKVTDDIKTHKNSALRQAAAGKPMPSPKPSIAAKPPPQKPAANPPKCALESKKWIVDASSALETILLFDGLHKCTI